MSLNALYLPSPPLVIWTTVRRPIVDEPKTDAATLKNSTSTESFSPQASDSNMVQAFATEEPKSKLMDASKFESLLHDAAKENDPFLALTKAFTKAITENGHHWTTFFTLENGAHVECQLAYDKWSSTCFAGKKPGQYRYIELFEHHPESGATDETPLVSIRLPEGQKAGEWLWLNRSKNISGKEAMSLGEKVSRCVKLGKSFLADTAKVKASDGISDIALLAPLLIIKGESYYAPLFALHDTKKKVIKSPITVAGTNELHIFSQNREKHKAGLTWIQAIKVDSIYNDILKDRPDDQKAFASLLKRNIPELKEIKGNLVEELPNHAWSLQKLMCHLYAKKSESKKCLTDYEWVYFNLLHPHPQTRNSEQQIQYRNTCKMLFDTMLMSANFT